MCRKFPVESFQDPFPWGREGHRIRPRGGVGRWCLSDTHRELWTRVGTRSWPCVGGPLQRCYSQREGLQQGSQQLGYILQSWGSIWWCTQDHSVTVPEGEGGRACLNLNLIFEQGFLPCKRRGQQWVVASTLGRGKKTFKTKKWKRTWKDKKHSLHTDRSAGFPRGHFLPLSHGGRQGNCRRPSLQLLCHCRTPVFQEALGPH